MRDPQRIDDFCVKLAEQWNRYPDFRFGQMMLNILNDFRTQHYDPFFVEDDKLVAYIEEWFDNFIGDNNA